MPDMPSYHMLSWIKQPISQTLVSFCIFLALEFTVALNKNFKNETGSFVFSLVGPITNSIHSLLWNRLKFENFFGLYPGALAIFQCLLFQYFWTRDCFYYHRISDIRMYGPNDWTKFKRKWLLVDLVYAATLMIIIRVEFQIEAYTS